MKTTDNKKGFTIIEVVLVLAIAALIFLMVFVAYPALSRGQRDTQRKNDLSRVQTALTNAKSNNRGNIPTPDSTFIDSYMKAGGDDFADPSGKDYSFSALGTGVPTGVDATDDSQTSVRIYYTSGATCSTTAAGDVTTGQGSRKMALRMVLEGGGVACVNV